MKHAGCFNGTKNTYMPKDQGKFDFSCHDPLRHMMGGIKMYRTVGMTR